MIRGGITLTSNYDQGLAFDSNCKIGCELASANHRKRDARRRSSLCHSSFLPCPNVCAVDELICGMDDDHGAIVESFNDLDN